MLKPLNAGVLESVLILCSKWKSTLLAREASSNDDKYDIMRHVHKEDMKNEMEISVTVQCYKGAKIPAMNLISSVLPLKDLVQEVLHVKELITLI